MKNSSLNNKISLGAILKSNILSVFTTLICILIFAFILNIFSLGSECIDIVNQIIKITSIIIGCLSLQKASKNTSISNFVILPIIYTLSTFIIFSLLNGSFYFDITLFNDMFFAVVIGLIYFLLLGRQSNKYYKKARR